VWLPEERTDPGRNRGAVADGRADVGATTGIAAEDRYDVAAARADVEEPPQPGRSPVQGALVRSSVDMYAHVLRLRQQLGDAMPRLDLYFEQESALRAAVLTAWSDAILAGTCNAYYVRIAKDMTAEEKKRIGEATRRRIHEYMEKTGIDYEGARLVFMREQLEQIDLARSQGDLKGLRCVKGP